jgi:hypothetical protein
MQTVFAANVRLNGCILVCSPRCGENVGGWGVAGASGGWPVLQSGGGKASSRRARKAIASLRI